MKVREEIKHIVDELPEDILGDLLKYMRRVEDASKDKSQLSLNLKKILHEDNDLLKRLAQ